MPHPGRAPAGRYSASHLIGGRVRVVSGQALIVSAWLDNITVLAGGQNQGTSGHVRLRPLQQQRMGAAARWQQRHSRCGRERRGGRDGRNEMGPHPTGWLLSRQRARGRGNRSTLHNAHYRHSAREVGGALRAAYTRAYPMDEEMSSASQRRPSRRASSQTRASRCRSAAAGRPGRARGSSPGAGHAATGTRVARRPRPRPPARQPVRP